MAATVALALSFTGIALSPSAPAAEAAPAATAPAFSQISAGAFSGTVPQGVCTVTATVVGGAGGSAVTTTSNANGAGASITATFPVAPGMTYSGTVGGGGGAPSGSTGTATPGPGGSNGGGTGGFSETFSSIRHHGAGGGGYTDLNLGGTLAILAGGGGGAGGGHSVGTDGTGGNAGLPTGTGAAAGSPGLKGKDTPVVSVTGGAGGGTVAATNAAGGTNAGDSAANGSASSGRTGGAGGHDDNPDAGGGGGGGYVGGGGGASTVGYNQQNGATEIAGAGGGGGSSYIAPTIPLGTGATSTPSSISSVAGPKITTSSSASGATGSTTLTWGMCAYDLSVDKSVSTANVAINSTVTWTVAVTNNGPAAMTQGDTVTIADTLPGTGAKTIASIGVSGGSNSALERGTFSCAVGVGATMPASLDCSRPYQLKGSSASGTRGLDVGETLTITYTQPVTEAAGTVLTNTATVTDRPSTPANNTDSATTTVIAPPGAVDDSSLGNALNTVVTLPVTTNDTGTIAANSVVLWNPGTSSVITSPYVVAGQGTWTVASNQVTFTPEPGFKGDPTPVTYRVSATNGLTSTATVTITYVPTASADSLTGLAIGATATVHPLANDNGTWDNASLRLINPSTLAAVTGPVVVAGQGSWSISGTDVVFTPLPGFLSDPSPISYRITDTTGDQVTAVITVGYVPAAANDSSLGNAIGTTVNLSVLTNDTGTFTTSSLVFSPSLATSLTVPGQGVWSIPSAGVIRFTPAGGYQGDPTPVSYRITDTTGDSVTATVTVTYVPSATNDSSTGNTIGAAVTVHPLTNDTGDFSAGTVRLMDGVTPVTILPVAGQGTWTVSGDDVVFTPLPGFLTDPSPVPYRVTDTTGDVASATITVTYVPQAVNDAQGGLTIGAVATVPVLTNDTGSWAAGTLRIMNGPTAQTSLTVAGQGVWTISGTSIVFTPQPGFLLDPTPITYRVTDTTGDDVTATVTLDYGPGAANDSSLGNALGTVVNLSVLTNDTGAFDQSTLGFAPGNTGVGATLVVAGQGTWEVRSGGVIRFTPLSTFLGDPTPQTYRVNDTSGDLTGATMTITYVPAASNDSDLDNAFGTDVNVPVLTNDQGDFTVASVRIMDGSTPRLTFAAPGQGTWSVQADGSITFHPEPGFLTDPSPITYRVTDTTGDQVTATVTVTYLPDAVDDAQGGLAIGSVATVPVLTNDLGDWVTSTLRLVNPTTSASVTSVTVPGEGVWTISGTNLVFTPQSGFLVDPTPIGYRITDSTGDTVGANVELDYGPGAADDTSLGHAIGDVVDQTVFTNDSGSFDAATLGFGPGNVGVGASVTVPGEGVWTVRAGGVVRFTPQSGFLTDPAPIRYYADDVTGDPADALVTVGYLPAAANDSDLGNAFGTVVNVDVLGNDLGDFPAGSVQLLNGAVPTTLLQVIGEGTWTVEADDTVTFTPESGFLTDPSVVHYRVTDSTGDSVEATITVTYLPRAVDDSRGNLTIGSFIAVPVLTNDDGDWVTSSLRILDGTTPVTSLPVPGQGTWTVVGANIVFTPQLGFLVDPDPIDYRVTDSTGDSAEATVTLDYVPAAIDDSDLGNTIGDDVDVTVIANDLGDFDLTTLGFGPGNVGVGASLVVAGEGAWTVRSGGVIRFSPEPGFLADPTPVVYHVTDTTGDATYATVTVTYLPAAADDSDLGNVLGTAVNVDALGNDTGDFVTGSIRLLDGTTPVLVLPVTGEGTWRVESDDTVTFTPLVGFLTDPAVVRYRVTDSTGDSVEASITVTYLPQASDDSSLGHTIGATVNVPVLGNDTGVFVATTVRMLDVTTPVVTLVVPGEGSWRANNDGTVTFTPLSGFLTDPAPAGYQVTDSTGDVVSAVVTVTYLPAATSDRKDGNALGSTVMVDVLANDTGDFDAASLELLDPVSHLYATSVTVTGQGTWDVTTNPGHVTFTPLPGYVGNPTPAGYRVTDTTGDRTTSTATVTYMPAATNDRSLGNKSGTPVSLSILGNDAGALDVTTARLLSGATPMMNLVVPGEGSWHMNATTGVVTFTPEPGFTGDPTPVPYRVLDINGNVASANITITYIRPTALSLALTGMSPQTPLFVAFGAILLGMGGVAISRLRRQTARHRA